MTVTDIRFRCTPIWITCKKPYKTVIYFYFVPVIASTNYACACLKKIKNHVFKLNTSDIHSTIKKKHCCKGSIPPFSFYIIIIISLICKYTGLEVNLDGPGKNCHTLRYELQIISDIWKLMWTYRKKPSAKICTSILINNIIIFYFLFFRFCSHMIQRYLRSVMLVRTTRMF